MSAEGGRGAEDDEVGPAPRVARDALAAGEAALPPYGSRFSRRDHTRPRFFALLAAA